MVESHAVVIGGKSLDAAALPKRLHRLELAFFARVGEAHAWSRGRTRPSVRGTPHVTSPLRFDWTGTLAEFLSDLARHDLKGGGFGVEDLEVNAVMERSGQINGELRADEIAALAALGACYTFSVMVD